MLRACAEDFWLLYQHTRESNDLEGAIVALATIVRDHPRKVSDANDPTMFRLAVALGQIDQVRRLEAVVTRITAHIKGYEAAALTLLGDAVAAREPEVAVEHYTRALEVPWDRNRVSAYTRLRLGQALLRLGRADMAQIAFAEADQDARLLRSEHSAIVSAAARDELAKLDPAVGPK